MDDERRITLRVVNQGSSQSPDALVSLTPLGDPRRPVPPLAAGAYVDITFPDPWMYAYMSPTIDPDNAVAEGNENNNGTSMFHVVYGMGPVTWILEPSGSWQYLEPE